MDTLYIVIPAYNEQENIRQLVKDWYPVVEKTGEMSRLVIINDGSRDHTWDILQELSPKYPQLKAIKKPNGGHGPTLLFGYRYALRHGADYVFQTDSDGQTDPEEFAAFWKMRRKYDVILGNRTVRGDGASRAFVEKVVCTLLYLYFGVRVPDANAPFRLMKAEVLEKYLDRLPRNYNLPNIMLTTYFVYYKEKTAFRRISFRPRQGGTNSLDIKKIVKIGWKALGDFRKLKQDM